VHQLWKVISGSPLGSEKKMGLEHVGTFAKLSHLKKFLRSDQIIQENIDAPQQVFLILTPKSVVYFKASKPDEFYILHDRLLIPAAAIASVPNTPLGSVKPDAAAGPEPVPAGVDSPTNRTGP
jgi:hypothetical protein